jgi:hypothetical protein
MAGAMSPARIIPSRIDCHHLRQNACQRASGLILKVSLRRSGRAWVDEPETFSAMMGSFVLDLVDSLIENA